MLIDKLICQDEEKLLDAFQLALQMEDGSEYMKRIRIEARHISSPKMLDLIYKTYLYRAKHGYFDDYMIYLEKDREASKRFYLPRRRVLLPIVNAIQDMLDDKVDLLSISLPPGTGKTTLEVFLMSYVCGMYPNVCNLMSGHSNTLCNSVYEGVLGILRDTDYAWNEIFPHCEIITNAKEQTLDIEKKHRFSTLTCCSIDGSLTGRTRCEGFLFADDLCSGIEEALSMERLDTLWTKYTNNLKSRKKLSCKEIHIATRWSVHDVIGRLETMYAENDRAKFISIPALDENDESNFNYDYGVGFDTNYFLDMKNSLDDVSWRCLFMNQPIEREGLLYHPNDMRFYYDLPNADADYIVAVCDTANGGGDDTVLITAYGYGDDWYIVDPVVTSKSPKVAEELCVEALFKNKVKMCQFESNTAGERIGNDVARMLKERGGHTSITSKYTTANKETKIYVNSTWVKEHCLFAKEPTDPMYKDFIKKMYSYTHMGKNKHDDVVDCLAQLSEYVQGLSGRKISFGHRF